MTATVPEHQGNDLRDYARVLQARKWQVALVALLSLGGALLYAFEATPVYRASAGVLVNAVLASPNQAQAPQPPNMDNERTVVTSPLLAGRVARRLGHPTEAEALLNGLTVTVPTNTFQLQISFESPKRAVVARIANAFAAEYVAFRTGQAASVIQASLRSLQSQLDQAQGQVSQLDSQIARAKPPERSALQGQRDSLLSRMGVLQQRVSDLQASLTVNENAAQVVGQATEPGSPASPNKIKDGVLGLVAGLILGIGIAFLRERFDDRMKSPEEIERRIGAPVLAAIPRVRSWRDASQTQLVMVSDPKSPIAESYRTLATNLRYAAARNELVVLMVTSALGGEGKTTTASNLSVALARSGKRVILVSADLRRPRVHAFFGLSNDGGLSDALNDPQGFLRIVKNPGQDNLRVMTGGAIPEDPAGLLAGSNAGRIVKTLRETSDFIIFDTPPVLAVADASILAPLVDATIVVMDAEHSSRSALHQAKNQLDNAGANIIGVVYNNFDPNAPGGYYASHYYYYQYYGQAAEPGEGVVTRRLRARRGRAEDNGFDRSEKRVEQPER